MGRYVLNFNKLIVIIKIKCVIKGNVSLVEEFEQLCSF